MTSKTTTAFSWPSGASKSLAVQRVLRGSGPVSNHHRVQPPDHGAARACGHDLSDARVDAEERGGPVFEAFRIAFIEISVGIEANSLKGGLAARGQRDASMS